MTYEIPQELQYQERIIFNLTLGQLLYAAAFGLVGFLIYAKTSLPIAAKIVILIILAVIASLFMYWDLLKKSETFFRWLRFRNAVLESPSMRRFLSLPEIKKDCYVVETPTGKRNVAVLSVEPINFKIKPSDERQSIIFSFQKFLNALDFPIQFVMYSDDLNLDSYVQELEKKVAEQKSKVFAEQFAGHKKFLQKLMKERASFNRKFLIAIPENELKLEGQLRIVQDLLRSMNLKSTRLNSRDLLKFLVHFFNTSPRKTVGDTAGYLSVAPDSLQNQSDCIKINDYYNRIVAAVGYPRSVEPGFLDKIITASGNFDLTIHVEPFPIENTLVNLNKELQKQRADLYAAEMKGKFTPSLEIQYQDTRSVLDRIQKGEEKLFHVSLYINAKSKDLDELKILTKTIQSQLNSILVIAQVPRYKMVEGIQSMLPFGVNKLQIRRNITTTALSAFMPFTSPFLILEKDGVFLGLNKNKLPIIKDIFSLSNANGTILATSGSGKSYTAKLIIARYLMNGTKVLVVDPQAEYTKLAEKFGGSVITIGRNSTTMINPLDMMDHDYGEKRLALLDLFNIMFGKLSDSQRAVLDKAISKTYGDAGIGPGSYEGLIPPLMSDLKKSLQELSKDAGFFEKSTYSMLLSRLDMYVDGVFSFMNRQTAIDLSNPFIVFNICDMPKQVKPVMMFLILDYIYSTMKKDKDRKLLVLDEAWSMLQHAQEEGYIFEIVKTCRKWNLGLLMITQDVADLLQGKAGRAVLANSSYTVLLRQKSAVIQSMDQVFHLSFTEREKLLTANPGQGILMMENDHQEIQVVASREEHNIITTNPNEKISEEVELVADAPINAQKMIAELDLECDVYKKSALKDIQIDYLIKHGYEKGLHTDPIKGAHELFLIKKRGNETQVHVFLCWRIYEELLGCTGSVKRVCASKNSLNPDITFTNQRGEEIAVEVETGTNYKHHLTYLRNKIEHLHETYPQRWCFFLTNAQYRRRYENLTSAPVFLRKYLRDFLRIHFPSGNPGRTYSNVTGGGLTHFVDEKIPLSKAPLQRVRRKSRNRKVGKRGGVR